MKLGARPSARPRLFGDGAAAAMLLHDGNIWRSAMAASKRKGGVQRILLVIFLIMLTVLQFESLIGASQVRKTMEIQAHPLLWDLMARGDDADSPCMNILGKNGTWVQDWNFSKHYGQYQSPLVIPPGPYVQKTWGKFQPSDSAPFRWETSWRWQDASQVCKIDYTVSAVKFCNVLYSLQVTRVLFFGDSLSQLMATSFLNKMGIDFVTTKPKPSNTTNAYKLEFPETNNTIRFLLAKEGGGHGSRSDPTRVNFTLSDVTRDFVASNPNRTLAILNIGAHSHTMDEYQKDIHILFDTIESFKRPSDLVFFRTTVPGHKGCKPVNPRRFNWTKGLRGVPLKSFADYIPTTQYAWNLFFDYNEYTKRKIAERTTKPQIHVLDVVNMTILRQDGHTGGRDCLHYFSPGPVDWWNHLLYTHLKELSGIVTSKSFAAVDMSLR